MGEMMKTPLLEVDNPQTQQSTSGQSNADFVFPGKYNNLVV